MIQTWHIRHMQIYCLVGSTPLKNMKVSRGCIPNVWEKNTRLPHVTTIKIIIMVVSHSRGKPFFTEVTYFHSYVE